MKLGRKNQLPTRRQRLKTEADRPSSSFSYRSRRLDRSRETGRQIQYELTKRKAGKLGRYWLQRFGLAVLLVAVAASLFNVLSLSSNAKVLPLATDGSRSFLRPISTYEAAASQLLGESVWNRNKITVNTANIRHQLLNKFPELTDVTVTVPLLAHRPIVYVQPAQPALILVAGNGVFVVDENGKALIVGANLAELNKPKLPVLNDQSGLRIRLNHQALSSANVSFIQTVIAQLAAKQLVVSSMALPASTRELNIVIAGQPYFVKFNLQSNTPREQAGTLLATLATLKRQNVMPAKYVDVRVAGRAYYQ
ncbi:MAG: hypothetical protein AAB971_03360 [Patescibacteria group bacterium]